MARPHSAPDVFRAISHPVRRHILDLLRQRPKRVAELVDSFNLKQGTLSEHLRVLRVAGLITYRAQGASHLYSLVRGRLRPIEEWLRPYQRSS